MRQVLFLCSGNYYRSRFAEAIFNHTAASRGFAMRAFSRGLAIHLVAGAGDLSVYTRFALVARGIPLHHTGAHPLQAAREDFQRATRVIAVKEQEHRPLMRDLFPDLENKIEYWNVHDLDAAAPDATVPELERLVLQVFDECAANAGAATASAAGR